MFENYKVYETTLAGWIGMLIAEIPLLVKNYRAYIKSIR